MVANGCLLLGGVFDNATIFGSVSMGTPYVKENIELDDDYNAMDISDYMIDAIENKRDNRCSGELSLHILDIIDSTINAAINNVGQDLRTNCTRPIVFSENEIKKLMK